MSAGSETFKNTYIEYAELWRTHLRHGLLWQTADRFGEQAKEYIAPTWSWVYLEGRVTWPYYFHNKKRSHFHNTFEVLEIGSRKGIENKFLQVRANIMSIAMALEYDDDDRCLYGERDTFPHDLFIKQLLAEREKQCEETSSKFTPETLQGPHDAAHAGRYTKFGEARLDLNDKDGLTFSGRQIYYMHVDNLRRPSCLVLERLSKDDGEEWARIGAASIYFPEFQFIHEGIWDVKDEIAQTCVLNII
jgi:hypothetical protein